MQPPSPLPHSERDARGADLEGIVQEVLRRLAALAALAGDAGAAGAPGMLRKTTVKGGSAETVTVAVGGSAPVTSGSNGNDGSNGDRRRLVISTRLVTLEAIAPRWSGVREVVVRADAIVTPLVRDELKQRGIQLTRCDQATAANGPAVVVGYCGAVDPRVERVLRSCGARVEQIWRSDERRVVPQMAQALREARALGILVSGRMAVATCLANRYASVRAVAGVRRSVVEEAVDGMAANLLVLSPTGDENAVAVEVFVRAGVRDCPEDWKPLLDAGV